jgi:tetratricopeptide (TPR) repeat protein
MDKNHPRLRIFISSPSDVGVERDRAEDVIRKVDADLWDVDIQVVRWEERAYSAVSTFQAQIDKPSDCDLVVCIFWKRLGTVLPKEFDRPDGSSRTGTEYEFEDALLAARARPEKVPDIFVYRNTASVLFREETLAQEQAEKQALDSFWYRWLRNEEGHFLAAFKGFAGADEFARQFERDLRDWVAARFRSADWDISVKGSPFLGLKAFDEKHASVFFGRRRATERLRATLMATAQHGFPCVFVLGASGAGKSSLVRAGLIPRLMVHGATDPLMAHWRRIAVTPTELGDDLIAGLARLLTADDVLPEMLTGDFKSIEAVASLMSAGPPQGVIPIAAALDRVAASLRHGSGGDENPATGLLLVIDQFEELFATQSDEARHQFLALLAALAESGRVWLIVTMRTDFYDALQADPPSLALKNRGALFDVEPPDGGDIREMIEGPARAAGLTYETTEGRELTELLEREAAQPGALPMLQFALQALFEARSGETLTLAEYDRLGGAAGALAHKAEEAFGRLEPEVQAELPRVLGALATIDLSGERTAATARPAELSAFPPGTPARRLIDTLLAERLLLAFGDTAGGGGAAPTIRIAHESLFQQWPRAAHLLADDRIDLDRRTRVERALKDHQAAVDEGDTANARERLLTGNALSNGVDLCARRKDLLSPPVIAFIEASQQVANAKRTRTRIIRTAAFATLAVLAGAAIVFGWQAEEKRREAQGNLETAQKTISSVLDTLEEPQMERVWGFTDVEEDVLLGLVKVQEELPGQGGDTGARSRALMNVRLGLAHQRRANQEDALKYYDQAFKLALPLAEQPNATPKDRSLLMRVAYYRHSALSRAGRDADLDRQVEVVAPIAERALSDPIERVDGEKERADSVKFSWATHYFDRLRDYYQQKDEYDRALAEINKAIAPTEKALAQFPNSIELRITLFILYSNRSLTYGLRGDTDKNADDFNRACTISGELYKEQPDSRGVVNGWLYCLLDSARNATNRRDRDTALKFLDEARSVSDTATRFAGTETRFHAAMGSERFQRAYLYQFVDGDLEKSRQTYEDALSEYAAILADRPAELPEHDYLLDTLDGYIEVADQIEALAPNQDLKNTIMADHAKRLRSVYDQFDACSKELGVTSVCARAVNKAGFAFASRMKQSGRISESVDVRARLVNLAEENAAHHDYAPYSEMFESACDTRREYGRSLIAASRPAEAVEVLNESVTLCGERFNLFPYDLYLRIAWLGAMELLAQAYVGVGDPANARHVLKSCTEAYGANCYAPYAKMLEDGVGGPKDVEEAERVRAIKAFTNMKRFTVPTIEKGSSIKKPFHLYIFERPPDWQYEGVEDQAIWLEENRGLIVPQDVRDSFIKLEKIAKENNVSFPDLCVYALGNASKPESDASVPVGNTADGNVTVSAEAPSPEASEPTAAQPPASNQAPSAPAPQTSSPTDEASGEEKPRSTEVAAASPLPSTPPATERPDVLYRQGLSRLIGGDLPAAATLFAGAADKGHPRAAYELAKLNLGLYSGPFSGNADEGLRLMREAADGGVPAAQLYMGVEAEKSGDIGTAVDWYKKAADERNTEAKERLRRLQQKG